MRLTYEWKDILAKAWSVRFMVLAALLTALEVAMPFFIHDMPRGLFAVASGVTTVAALVARVIVQRDL